MPSISFLLIYQQYKPLTAKKYKYITLLIVPPTVGIAANKSATPLSGCLKGKACKEAKQYIQVNTIYIYFVSILEKPSKNFLDLLNIILPTLSSPINLKYIVKNNKSKTKCIFAFITLLKDFIKLHQEVTIKLTYSMEEEIMPLLKNYSGILALLPKYFGIPRRIVYNKCLAIPDKAALLEVVSNIALLFEIKGIPMLNEFTYGVKYMFKTTGVRYTAKPGAMLYTVQLYIALIATNRRKDKYSKVLLQRLRAGICKLKFRAPISLCYIARATVNRKIKAKAKAVPADDIGLPLMLYIITDVIDITGLIFAIAAKEMASKSGQSNGVLGKVVMVIWEYVIVELDVDKCPI
ncbi:hypothetical protein BKA59DRAFT_488946 [Fusarium tricinctum]|uniref:Uncharacterized protein n=1 Tax=Fusarium tricinctum TaxID=61284 RepID=A0A8K0S7C0_9HYPO|nr:hypothetical protein BKA59DRAFT_488946 [Fusarium tricinctum]